MKIVYSSNFLKQFKKIPKELQIEINDRIKLFQKNSKNATFKVHKLHVKLSEYCALSINYYYRIIFKKTKEFYIFAEIGTHEIYK